MALQSDDKFLVNRSGVDYSVTHANVIKTAIEATSKEEADRIAADALKVNKAGDTMTGNLTVPSLNGGALAAFRNILINPDLQINQRGAGVGSFLSGSQSNGTYGPDRWKQISTNGFTQVVEAGSFRPATRYTLSINGVKIGTKTSPSSGNWNICNTSFAAIPFNSRRVQLEEGEVVTPFEIRPLALELQMCYRYYQRLAHAGIIGTGMSVNGDGKCRFFVPFPNGEMRISPSINRPNGSDGFMDVSGKVTTGRYENVTTSGFEQQFDDTSSGTSREANILLLTSGIVTINAEL